MNNRDIKVDICVGRDQFVFVYQKLLIEIELHFSTPSELQISYSLWTLSNPYSFASIFVSRQSVQRKDGLTGLLDEDLQKIFRQPKLFFEDAVLPNLLFPYTIEWIVLWILIISVRKPIKSSSRYNFRSKSKKGSGERCKRNS